MDLDIRGEMEAAASEMESAGADFDSGATAVAETSPVSEPETTAKAEDTQPATDDSPAKEGSPADAAVPVAKPDATEEDNYELPLGGSIPVPRVRKIIENARRKAVDEYKATLPKESDEEKAARAAALEFYQFAEQNPMEFYRRVTHRLKSDPVYGQEVERLFAPKAEPVKPKEDPDPKPTPDVLLTDGRFVYSDARQQELLEWHARQIERKVESRVKPIEQSREQAKLMAEVDQMASSVLDEALKWPGMSDAENQKAVGKAMMEHGVDINAAYRMVIVPKLADTSATEKRIREQVLAELKQKARAGSTQRPSAPVTDPSAFAGKSIREVLEATADELGFKD